MGIVMLGLDIVLFSFLYLLYYVNIHNTVSLISEETKFTKISCVVAVLNLAVQLFIHTTGADLPGAGAVRWSSSFFVFLSVFLSHRKEPLKTAYVTELYFCVEACPGSTVNILVNLFVPVSYRSLSTHIVYVIYSTLYYFVLKKFMRPRKDDLNLSLGFIDRKTYIFILAYAWFLSMMISYITVATAYDFDKQEVFNYMRLFIIPLWILSFVIITILVVNNMSKFYYKRSAELLDKQLDMQAKYYEKIGEMTTDIRKFRHDYKNHMHCLKLLLDSDKTADAREYLDSISNNPTMNSTSFKSGNTIADAILNDKAAIAARENFRLNFSGVISEKVSAFDICTILSNALDNSIEACRRLKNAEEKFIEVNCTLKNDTQVISISNPSDTEATGLKTSKANKNEHGFGLYNIRKTVDALDGTVNIPQTSPVFVLDVMFRIRAAETKTA